MEDRENSLHSFCSASTVKRSIDVAVAAIGILILSPILGAVAAAMLLVMGRPVFFRQIRPGYMAKPFTLYKFRTMREVYDDDGTLRPDAERLTRLGRLLRRASLDELPQLWNVLWGDLSLIGPRPLLMQYLPLYTPGQARRHDVRPGITGWAQVNGRNAIGWEQKFDLDTWYVDHWTLGLDIKILAMTVIKVLNMEGISGKGEATMAPFTGTDKGEQCDRSGSSVQVVTPKS